MEKIKYIIVDHKDNDGSFYDTSMFPKTEDSMGNYFMTHDSETGVKFEIAHEFEAESWEDACQIMNLFLGYGKYTPMLKMIKNEIQSW